MKKDFEIFIHHWHEIVLIWAEITLLASVVVFFYYHLLLVFRRKPTRKHEFMEKNEIKYYWLTTAGLIVSFSLFLNSVIVRENVTSTSFILTVKTFVTIGVGFMLAYFANIYLHVYYPFRLEKKLHRLRFKRRVSPVTGNKMRMLTEEEEDVHLTKDMIEHEKINAYEYDVWVDEESDFKLIETYKGSLHLVICQKCSYRTAHEIKEEMILEPTDGEEGLLKKYYKCSYCDHEQTITSKIAPLMST